MKRKMNRRRKPCEICQQLIAPQGMPGHVKKHKREQNSNGRIESFTFNETVFIAVDAKTAEKLKRELSQ